MKSAGPGRRADAAIILSPVDGSGETQRWGVGDAVAWTRRLTHGGAESATPAGTEGLRGAEGPFAGPPRLVRGLQRVRTAALHRKGFEGGCGCVCVEWGVHHGRAGAAGSDPHPLGGAGAEPRPG